MYGLQHKSPCESLYRHAAYEAHGGLDKSLDLSKAHKTNVADFDHSIGRIAI